MNQSQKEKLDKKLKSAKNVYVHNGSLRIHFKLPGQTKVTKKSLAMPSTINNIKLSAIKLAQVKGDIASGLYDVSPEKFWKNIFLQTP